MGLRPGSHEAPRRQAARLGFRPAAVRRGAAGLVEPQPAPLVEALRHSAPGAGTRSLRRCISLSWRRPTPRAPSASPTRAPCPTRQTAASGARARACALLVSHACTCTGAPAPPRAESPTPPHHKLAMHHIQACLTLAARVQVHVLRLCHAVGHAPERGGIPTRLCVAGQGSRAGRGGAAARAGRRRARERGGGGARPLALRCRVCPW